MSDKTTEYKAWKLTPQPIDYKKLEPKDFPWAKFEDNPHIILDPDEKGFISVQLTDLLVAAADKSETCIINIGVGRGKTSAAYNIINHFYDLEKYVVIMVAPFKKLVTRDFKEFERKKHVVHYEMLDDRNVSDKKMKEAKILGY